jgi:hypothetical protein
MPAKYEWKVGRNGNRKYVRTVVRDEPTTNVVATPFVVTPEAVAEITDVPEIKIEDPQQVTAKRGPGRPKKAAPVEIKDGDDD